MERKKAIKETLATVKQVDENIWTLVYKGSYGLDELLEKGVSGMLGIIRFAQKYIHSKQVFLKIPTCTRRLKTVYFSQIDLYIAAFWDFQKPFS